MSLQVGYFLQDLEKADRGILPYLRTYRRVSEALVEVNEKAERLKKLEEINSFDCVILPEAWAYHNYKQGEIFEKWCMNEITLETPVITHLIHVRESYGKRKYQNGMLEKSDGFISSSDYTSNLPKPSTTLKFGTYMIEEKLENLSKDDVIRAPMGRLNERSMRMETLKKCPLDIKLSGKPRGHKKHYKSLNLPENIEYTGSFSEGTEIYRKSKFIYEATTEDWLVPKSNPRPYWSDRIGHAVSHGCHLITDYTPALEQWNSTISHEEAYEGNLEYNLEAIKRDRDKWLYKKRVGRIAELAKRIINE